jgi:hypothetical protein
MKLSSARLAYLRAFVVLLAASLLGSVVDLRQAVGQNTHPEIPSAKWEEDIYEAVIRIQMERWYQGYDKQVREAKEKWEVDSANEMNFQVFLVSINGKDPSGEFLGRFKDIPRLVERGSLGSFVKEPFPGWLHYKKDGRRAINFDAEGIKWKSDSTVEVGGGHYCGGLCAATYVFRLQLLNGKWIVKESELKVIS